MRPAAPRAGPARIAMSGSTRPYRPPSALPACRRRATGPGAVPPGGEAPMRARWHRERRRAARARRLQQPPPRAGPCILAGRPGSGDDVVIAGGFAIEIDVAREPAHRGMQPANGTCDSLQQLQPVVVPREVRVFVHDHLIERGIVQPLDESASDDDDRAAESDCAGTSKTFPKSAGWQGGARARAYLTTTAAAPRARHRRALTSS